MVRLRAMSMQYTVQLYQTLCEHAQCMAQWDFQAATRLTRQYNPDTAYRTAIRTSLDDRNDVRKS